MRVMEDTPKDKEKSIPLGSSGIILHNGMRTGRLGGDSIRAIHIKRKNPELKEALIDLDGFLFG